MFKRTFLAAIVATTAVVPALANDFADELGALAKSEISAITAMPALIEAIKAQNAQTADHDQAKIDELDQTWRAEADSFDQPMIDEVLGRAGSVALAEVREGSGGKFTEIFVMDAKGLNVAQSDPTSDYWQGDEAKWQETFLKGADAIHISEIEEDESTQTFQSQVSMSITDPANGDVIGAITVGVNVDKI